MPFHKAAAATMPSIPTMTSLICKLFLHHRGLEVKGKGDPMECGSYRGIKLLEHAVKVVERIFEDRIRQRIDIDDMQFGFMKGKGTTDAILNTSLSTRIASRVLMLLNIRPSHLSVRTRELWHNG